MHNLMHIKNLILFGCLWSACVLYSKPHAHAATFDADAWLKKNGIVTPKKCQDFSKRSKLQARHKVWNKAIAKIAKKHKKHLISWIIGAKEPPRMVLKETSLQRDCLLKAITKDAAKPGSKLMLDFGDGGHKKSHMKRWSKRLKKRSWMRRAANHFTRSHYRSASMQAGIWWRKYSFAPARSFHAITKIAAKKCRLTEGYSWKPTRKHHKTCWKKKLTSRERQQEILHASSAPGLSRHHWGTDIDIFGLNPRTFRGKGALSDEYHWLQLHALDHGFFQTYLGPASLGQESYMEERWHWSYHPISQALFAWAQDHKQDISKALGAQWNGFEKRFGKPKTSPFSYVRQKWQSYFFHIAKAALGKT